MTTTDTVHVFAYRTDESAHRSPRAVHRAGRRANASICEGGRCCRAAGASASGRTGCSERRTADVVLDRSIDSAG
jgi:hypothetical protein